METNNKLENKIFRFKTNIKCMGCVSKVTPVMNEEVGVDNWEVDTQSLDKILTVKGIGIDSSDVIHAIESTGFKLEIINN